MAMLASDCFFTPSEMDEILSGFAIPWAKTTEAGLGAALNQGCQAYGVSVEPARENGFMWDMTGSADGSNTGLPLEAKCAGLAFAMSKRRGSQGYCSPGFQTKSAQLVHGKKKWTETAGYTCQLVHPADGWVTISFYFHDSLEETCPEYLLEHMPENYRRMMQRHSGKMALAKIPYSSSQWEHELHGVHEWLQKPGASSYVYLRLTYDEAADDLVVTLTNGKTIPGYKYIIPHSAELPAAQVAVNTIVQSVTTGNTNTWVQLCRRLTREQQVELQNEETTLRYLTDAGFQAKRAPINGTVVDCVIIGTNQQFKSLIRADKGYGPYLTAGTTHGGDNDTHYVEDEINGMVFQFGTCHGIPAPPGSGLQGVAEERCKRFVLYVHCSKLKDMGALRTRAQADAGVKKGGTCCSVNLYFREWSGMGCKPRLYQDLWELVIDLEKEDGPAELAQRMAGGEPNLWFVQDNERAMFKRFKTYQSSTWARRGAPLTSYRATSKDWGQALGKTLRWRYVVLDEALGVAACFGPEDWPLLIVCPSIMKLVWKEAVLAWLPLDLKPSPRNLVVVNDAASMGDKLDAMDLSTPVRVLIVSYDMARKLEGRAAGYLTVIADESHLLKSMDAQRTKAVDRLVRAASRAILCTGTPALSRPVELFPQVSMLRPGMFGSLQEFGMRYCDGRPAQFQGGAGVVGGYDYRGASNLQELNQRLERFIMVRRLKKDVLDELPDKIRKRIPVETDPAHRAALQETQRAMQQLKQDEAVGLLDTQQAQQQAQRLSTELYRRTGPAKVKEVAAHVAALLEAGEKLLIFGHHSEVLDELQRRVLERSASNPQGVPFVRIDGQVVNERRKEAVERFQGSPACRAALLSITAAGVGITLTEATVVVFAELYWTPGVLVQAEDRAHRLGQRQPLEVHYLVAPGTADDAIWEKCKQKLAVVGDALGQEHAEEAFEVPSARNYQSGGQQRALQQQPEVRPAALLQGIHASQERQQQATPPQAEQRQEQQQHQQQQQQQTEQGGSATGARAAAAGEPEVIVISDTDSEGDAAGAARTARAVSGQPVRRTPMRGAGAAGRAVGTPQRAKRGPPDDQDVEHAEQEEGQAERRVRQRLAP